jgi:hypothetical protein
VSGRVRQTARLLPATPREAFLPDCDSAFARAGETIISVEKAYAGDR